VARRKRGPRCAACHGRIPDHEPDYMLTDVETQRRTFYHERCVAKAYEKVTSAAAVHVLTHRYVEEMAN
jgi:hypothetical protein